MAVSLTSTVNLLFGSQLMVQETGVIMNNEMNDFSIPNSTNAFGFIPSPANFVKHGKRPLSSISPMIVEYSHNDTLHVVIGTAGGLRIITATVQGIWNIDRKMNAEQTIREPRFHEQLVPNQVSIERSQLWSLSTDDDQMMFEHVYDNRTIGSMLGKGHIPAWLDHGSDLQIIRRLSNGTFEAASESRQHDSGAFTV